MLVVCVLAVGALAWNADLLASGSRDRMIMLHDTRVVPVVPEKRLAGHRQEVSHRIRLTSFGISKYVSERSIIVCKMAKSCWHYRKWQEGMMGKIGLRTFPEISQ